MSLVGRRIRKWNGDEGIVLEVALGADAEWVALVRRDDGKLEAWDLDRNAAVHEVEHKPEPYVRPPPTSMPGGGK